MGTTRPEVLVVGAGIIGVATAYELSCRGVEVVVIEARDVVGAECSYGNAGLISPSHCIPLARPGLLKQLPHWLRPGGAIHIKPRPSLDLARFGLALAQSCTRQQMLAGLRALRDLAGISRDLIEDLVRQGFDFDYQRVGLMNVSATPASFELLRADAELLRAEGFSPEILTAHQAHDQEPALSPDIAGAVLWEEDGHCEPAQMVAELAAAARCNGARFELGTRVEGFKRAADGSITAVLTTGGTWFPRRVVLSAGVWTSKLARLAGTRIPLQPGKGYHVQLGQGAIQLRRPLLFQESVIAATPMRQGLRFAGTMEFCGLRSDSTDPLAAFRLLEEARVYLVGLKDEGNVSIWSGLRPCTPDSLPLIGASTRVPNLLFATGHAMLGMTLGPVSGRAVADLVEGSTTLPVSLLSPRRYGA